MINLIRKLKNWLIAILGIGVCFASPIIPAQTQWIVSYETIQFTNGDLKINEYAITEDGYYIRTKPQNRAQFEKVGLNYDISGLTQVEIVCERCAYYSEFLLKNGKKIRVPYTQEKYNGLRHIPNYQQPNYSEKVSLISKADAIVYDAVSIDGETQAVSSMSWSHTSTTSVNALLVVGVGLYDITAGDRNVATTTYNGIAMTEVAENTQVDNYTSLWYLIAPSTGANTVSVTLGGTNDFAYGGGISLSGVKQSAQPDAYSSGGASSTLATTTVTTIADNSWVIDITSSVHFGVDCPGEVVGANQTVRWNTQGTYGAAQSTEGPQTPAGNVEMTWDFSGTGCGAQDWSMVSASFSPYIEAGAVAPSPSVIIIE